MFSQSYNVFMFQRMKFCTRTTKRKPCTMIQMRTQSPKNPSQTRALWSSSNPSGPPGVNSAWWATVQKHTHKGRLSTFLSFDGHLQLYTRHNCLFVSELHHKHSDSECWYKNVVQPCCCGCLWWREREIERESRWFLSKRGREGEGEWAGIS